MRLGWLALCLGLACGSAQGVLAAQAPMVVVLSSSGGGAYAEAAQALHQRLQAQVGSAVRLQMQALDTQPPRAIPPEAQLWVALGSQACAELAARPLASPLLCALLPRAAIERVARKSGRSLGPRWGGIALDPGFETQLGLIQLALPQARQVGVLWGAESQARAPALRAAARAQGLVLAEARGDPPDALNDALSALRDVDLILAVPDPQVFNAGSVQNILLTTFRARVPLIGFSPAYVRAGALLSLHVTPAQAGAQAATEVARVLAGGALAEQVLEPDDFEVAVNASVAHALRLSLDAVVLRARLRALFLGDHAAGS